MVDLSAEEALTSYFSAKSPIWEIEGEVRVIFNWCNDYLKIPLDIIDSIYIGARCPRQDEDLIIKSLDGMNIEFHRMKFKNDSFEMYSEEIKS